ncbi:signal transduction histidine kinase [Clostridiales Family XIII bacterium PM5-7]
MDTKWKNIIKDNIRVILCGLIGLVGIVLIGMLFWYYQTGHYVNTKRTWTIGVVAAILICQAVYQIIIVMLTVRHRDWVPENDDFYSEWDEKWKKQQQTMGIVFVVALVFVLFTFVFNRMLYYYGNYAFNYFMLALIVCLYGTCQLAVQRQMKKKLGEMMTCVREVNKEKLAAAIKLEMESIEKVKKSEQMKVDLISNVSHDLKTPLTSMIGYIELMKKEELTDIMKDYVDVLSNKSEKLKEMIESLFSLAKASSGNISLNVETIQLNKLIEQLLADMNSQIEKSGLQFVPILTESDTHFMTDNAHLYRVCQNLFENAIKYSAKGTRVFIKTFVREGKLGERLYFEITNTAGYLMDFDAESIIERFSRGDESRSTDGNGLGLAIVSTYTSALGGAFDLQIDYDQFKVTLSFPIEIE